MPKPASRRLLASVVLAATAVAALTGCRTSPGAAAIIGQQQISDAQLDSAVQAALTNPTVAAQVTDRAAFTRQELSARIQLQLFRAAAAAKGVAVTPAQVQAQIAQITQQAGGRLAFERSAAGEGVAPSDVALNVEISLLVDALARAAGISDPTSQQVQQQVSAVALHALSTEYKKLGVHIDPRYGTWNPSSARIEPAVSTIARPAT